MKSLCSCFACRNNMGACVADEFTVYQVDPHHLPTSVRLKNRGLAQADDLAADPEKMFGGLTKTIVVASVVGLMLMWWMRK